MDNNNTEDIKKYELLLEMQKTLFLFQDDSDNTVDNKLSVFLAFCVAIIIGVLTLDNSDLIYLKQKEQYAGIIIMFLAACFFIYGMHTKRYRDLFVGAQRLETNLDYKATLMQRLSDCVFATDENKKNLKKKVFYYKIGLSFLILGTLLISLSLLDVIIIYI